MIHCWSFITERFSYINGVSTPTHQTVLSGSASFALYENEAQTFFTVCSWRVALNCLLNSRATSLMSECAWISSLNFLFFTRPLGNVKRIRERRRGARGRFEWKANNKQQQSRRSSVWARTDTAQRRRRDQTPGVTCLIQTELFRLVDHPSDENLNKAYNTFWSNFLKKRDKYGKYNRTVVFLSMMSYFRL